MISEPRRSVSFELGMEINKNINDCWVGASIIFGTKGGIFEQI